MAALWKPNTLISENRRATCLSPQWRSFVQHIQISWQGSWEGFWLQLAAYLYLRSGSYVLLPCWSTALLKSLSGHLSAHVIEGPVAIYEEFYISGFNSKVLPPFQTPQVLCSVWISLHVQQGMRCLVYALWNKGIGDVPSWIVLYFWLFLLKEFSK